MLIFVTRRDTDLNPQASISLHRNEPKRIGLERSLVADATMVGESSVGLHPLIPLLTLQPQGGQVANRGRSTRSGRKDEFSTQPNEQSDAHDKA